MIYVVPSLVVTHSLSNNLTSGNAVAPPMDTSEHCELALSVDISSHDDE